MKKMVFFRMAWADKYDGTDKYMGGGGGYVDAYGFGSEAYNFLPYRGKYYGYVGMGKDASLHIERIGEPKETDHQGKYVDDVLVVWFAKSPHGGQRVVGWYEHARVYSEYQESPPDKRRLNPRKRNERIGYYAVADAKNCVLLNEDQRFLEVPNGKNASGETNVWYADKGIQTQNRFKREVLRLIAKHKAGKIRNSAKDGKRKSGWQTDPESRARIEDIASAEAKGYYKKMGYEVKDVSKENLGWDLEATNHYHTLKVEVKGLSGPEISFQVTPNEYSKMKKYKSKYELFVVTNALNEPKHHIFQYSAGRSKNRQWVSLKGKELMIDEKIAAHMYVE